MSFGQLGGQARDYHPARIEIQGVSILSRARGVDFPRIVSIQKFKSGGGGDARQVKGLGGGRVIVDFEFQGTTRAAGVDAGNLEIKRFDRAGNSL